jgi:hypothetical protein
VVSKTMEPFDGRLEVPVAGGALNAYAIRDSEDSCGT